MRETREAPRSFSDLFSGSKMTQEDGSLKPVLIHQLITAALSNFLSDQHHVRQPIIYLSRHHLSGSQKGLTGASCIFIFFLFSLSGTCAGTKAPS